MTGQNKKRTSLTLTCKMKENNRVAENLQKVMLRTSQPIAEQLFLWFLEKIFTFVATKTNAKKREVNSKV